MDTLEGRITQWVTSANSTSPSEVYYYRHYEKFKLGGQVVCLALSLYKSTHGDYETETLYIGEESYQPKTSYMYVKTSTEAVLGCLVETSTGVGFIRCPTEDIYRGFREVVGTHVMAVQQVGMITIFGHRYEMSIPQSDIVRRIPPREGLQVHSVRCPFLDKEDKLTMEATIQLARCADGYYYPMDLRIHEIAKDDVYPFTYATMNLTQKVGYLVDPADPSPLVASSGDTIQGVDHPQAETQTIGCNRWSILTADSNLPSDYPNMNRSTKRTISSMSGIRTKYVCDDVMMNNTRTSDVDVNDLSQVQDSGLNPYIWTGKSIMDSNKEDELRNDLDSVGRMSMSQHSHMTRCEYKAPISPNPSKGVLLATVHKVPPTTNRFTIDSPLSDISALFDTTTKNPMSGLGQSRSAASKSPNKYVHSPPDHVDPFCHSQARPKEILSTPGDQHTGDSQVESVLSEDFKIENTPKVSDFPVRLTSCRKLFTCAGQANKRNNTPDVQPGRDVTYQHGHHTVRAFHPQDQASTSRQAIERGYMGKCPRKLPTIHNIPQQISRFTIDSPLTDISALFDTSKKNQTGSVVTKSPNKYAHSPPDHVDPFCHSQARPKEIQSTPGDHHTGDSQVESVLSEDLLFKIETTPKVSDFPTRLTSCRKLFICAGQASKRNSSPDVQPGRDVSYQHRHHTVRALHPQDQASTSRQAIERGYMGNCPRKLPRLASTPLVRGQSDYVDQQIKVMSSTSTSNLCGKIDGLPKQTLAQVNATTSADVVSSLLTEPLRAIPGGFENLTSIVVPKDVATLLSFGVKFVPPHLPNISDYVNGLYAVDRISMNVCKNPRDHLQGYLIQSYRQLLNTSVRKFTSYEERINGMMKNTQQFLETHSTTSLVQSDKGKSLVLMTVSDYHIKMEELMSKNLLKGNYKLIEAPESDEIRAFWAKECRNLSTRILGTCCSAKARRADAPIPGKLQVMLREYQGSDVSLPYLYGNIKTHKDTKPMRPICSTRNWYSYPLQKVICHTLTLATTGLLSVSNVKNIDDAAMKIRASVVLESHEFIKMDVEDMYPSINRQELLQMLKVFINSPRYDKEKLIDPVLLMDCLELCLGQNSLFTYNGRIYLHLLGLPQGACDSGLLATMMLDHYMLLYESQILQSNHVSMHLKYVDDILFIVDRHCKESLMASMERWTRLKYTMEEEVMSPIPYIDGALVLGSITFLDLEIFRCSEKLYVRCYQKPMASLRTCHFLSQCKAIWKENTLRYYINRVLGRVNNPFLLAELYTLEHRFEVNMYPRVLYSHIIIECVTKHVKVCLSARWHPPQDRCKICTLGDVRDRCEILADYIRCIGPLPYRTFKDLRGVMRTNLIFPKNPERFTRAVPYLCEEFSAVIRNIYHLLEGGVLTHKNGPNLLRLLQVQKGKKPPKEMSNKPRVWVFSCPDCNLHYILCGQGQAHELLDEAMAMPGNSIAHHMSVSNHGDPTRGVCDQLRLDGQGEIPAYDRVSLMKAIYDALGFEVTEKSELLSIPVYVRNGLAELAKYTMDKEFNFDRHRLAFNYKP